MKFKICASLLFAAVVADEVKESFTEVECEYVFATTSVNQVVTSGSDEKALYDIGVFANKDLSGNRTLEIQPAAVISTYGAYYSILNNYVFGLNKSHAVMFFGSSGVFNHGRQPNVEQALVAAKVPRFGRAGVVDVAINLTTAVKKGDEMFSFYNALDPYVEEQTVIPWFEARGIPYVNTADPSVYAGKLESSSKILPGCSDCYHLVVIRARVYTRLHINAGDILETNRVLFVYNFIGEGELIEDLFWKLTGNKKALSIGVIMPFAKFTSDPDEANVEAEWWNDQFFYSQDHGIISIRATKNISAGDEIVILSDSVESRELPENMRKSVEAQVSWWTWAKDTAYLAPIERKIASVVFGLWLSMFLWT